MLPSLRALLEGIIDYAGLFPPASLPLDQAIGNYVRYRAEPESWMLARFVFPVKRLAELHVHRDELPQPFRVSMLGSDVESSQVGVSALVHELCALRLARGSCQYFDQKVHVDTYEVRLSIVLIREAKKEAALAEMVQATTEQIDAALEEQRLPLVTDFFEVEACSEWPAHLKTAARILRRDPLRRQGIKVRSGGLNAAAFPPPEQIAFAITTCRDAGVPLKFTAGLHHPIRHLDRQMQTKMHGFLNVFGAGVLAHARNLNQEQVEQIVADEDVGHFVFEEDGFRWKDWRATVEEIRAARQQLVTSFGSCSFDEPRDDLRTLGLLP